MTERFCNDWLRVAVRGWLVAAALVGVSLSAHAQLTSAKKDFAAWMDQVTGGTKHTVTFGSNGTPLVSSGVPNATQAGNMNFGHQPGGWPSASGTAQVPSPAGPKVPVTAAQKFTTQSMGKALAKFAGTALPILGAGIAIYELLQELGLDGSQQPTGVTNWHFSYPEYPYYIKRDSVGNAQGGETYPTPEAACQAHVGNGRCYNNGIEYYCAAQLIGSAPGYTPPGRVRQCLKIFTKIAFDSPEVGTHSALVSGEGTPTGQTTTGPDLGPEELQQLIASQSGWPSGSAVDRALADAVNSGKVENVLEPLGNPTITPSTTKVTGPAVQSTTTGSDGSTRTTTTKTVCDLIVPIGGNTIEYQCNTVTDTSQTTLTPTTSTNPDGTTTTTSVPTTTTTTTTVTTTNPDGTKGDPNQQESCTQGSSEVRCATLDTPDGSVPSGTANVSYSPENLGFGGGSCPAPFAWTDSLGSHAVNLAPFCETVSTWVRPVVLALGALMATMICLAAVRS